MKTSKVVLIALSGLTVFLLAFALTQASLASTPLPLANGDIANVQLDGWKYQVQRDEHNLVLSVAIDDTSAAGLDKFRMANLVLSHELLKEQATLQANIVFRKPMSLAEVTALAQKYDLATLRTELRIISGNGERITLMTAPENKSLISESFVQSTQEWIKAQTGEANLLGIVSLQAVIPATQYPLLIDAPEVFMVDVSGLYAQQNFLQQFGSRLQAADTFILQSPSLYWYLEDLENQSASK